MLFNKIKKLESKVVNVVTATLQVSNMDHANKVLTLNRAGGIALTLPIATGSGDKFTFVVGTTFTTAGTIKVPNAATTFIGNAIIAQDSGDTGVLFEAGATADTVTMNGTTMGGLQGQIVEVIDVAANLFFVRVISAATGIEATPFSATVS